MDPIASNTVTGEQRIYDFDVTEEVLAQIAEDGIASFIVKSLETNGEYNRVEFRSKERGRNVPKLVVICDKDPELVKAFSEGIELESSDSPSLELYPNPVDNQLTLELYGVKEGGAKINILDMTGRSLQEQMVNIEGDELRLVIPVSSFAQGMYVIQVQLGEQRLMKRFIKND